MRVSVVIPTYSRPELLRLALQSIAAQSYPNWEVIVVDDGSDPQVTAQDISQVVGDRFRLLHHPQSLGTAAAKNRGVAAASGDLITLLDDDDLLEPFALQTITEVFAAHSDIDCLFINITPFGRFADRAIVNQGTALEKVIAGAAENRDQDLILLGPALFATLLKTTPIPMQRPVASPEIWKKVGNFSPGIMCPEPAWSARAALLCKTALLSTPVYRWRVDGQNHASRPEMQPASIDCILQDRVLLMKTMKDGVLGDHLDRRVLRTSVATLLLDQAMESLVQGRRIEALRRLGSSLQYAVSWRSAKTAARLLLPWRFRHFCNNLYRSTTTCGIQLLDSLTNNQHKPGTGSGKAQVSIVIPTLAKGLHAERLNTLHKLLSVYLPAQTHQHYQAIVYCDGYNKNVAHMVAALNDPRVHVFATDDSVKSFWGHPQTRLGIDIAKGDYFVRINDDNRPRPDYLHTLLQGFHGDTGISYARVTFRGEARNAYSYLLHGSFVIPRDRHGTLENGNIDCLCYMVRMELARHYRDSWGDMYAADWRFLEAMLADGVKTHYTNRLIADKY